MRPRVRFRTRAYAIDPPRVGACARERTDERVSEWMDGRADQGFGTIAN